MKTTSVFSKTLKAYNDGFRMMANYGSTRSSKTYSALQLLYLIAKYKTETISIVSKSLAHLKLGTMRDWDSILRQNGHIISDVKNVQESKYIIGNSIIDFFGADQDDKVHGPQRSILFINEGNFIKESVVTQLLIRTSGAVFVDYNPSSDFWIDDEVYKDREDIAYIHSTYLENEHLSEKQVNEIESRRKNEHWWRVYGLGLKGRLEGSVYTDWETGKFDDSLPFGYGLDFGYSPDPDCLVKCAVDNKKKIIYLHEELRQNNQSSANLAKSIKRIVKNKVVYADSAEKRLINDIKIGGVYIKKTKKGAGSVLANIRLIQGYKIVVTSESSKLIRELETYVWHDKKSGVPVDKNNHGLDAFSYYVRMVINSSYTINIH